MAGKQITIQEIKYIKQITQYMVIQYEKHVAERYVRHKEFYINKN